MTLLRRQHRLKPLEITTAPAPVLGVGHVDVCAGGVAPVASPAHTLPSLVEVDLPAADVALEYVDGSPSVDRGQCYHHLHFDFDGRRFGALVHPHQHSASLLPCPYVGKAGR